MLFRSPVFVDPSVADRKNMVTGANEDGFHVKNVDVRRDLLGHGKVADLRSVKPGEGCPMCDGTLDLFKALEVGHIFKLGTKYSESMNCVFLDEAGARQPMIMGCYGLGIGRTVAAAVEPEDRKSVV